MKFFLDNCLSPAYARALRELAAIQEYGIVHLREMLEPGTQDVTWIGILGEEKDWVIMSDDPRISRNKAERRAWHESGLTAFFFSDDFSRRGYWKQAADIVRWWPEIVLKARGSPTGTDYLIPVKSSEMKCIYSPG